jgi:hypothetical protein
VEPRFQPVDPAGGQSRQFLIQPYLLLRERSSPLWRRSDRDDQAVPSPDRQYRRAGGTVQEALVHVRREPQAAEKLLSGTWQVSNRLICPQAVSDRAGEAIC